MAGERPTQVNLAEQVTVIIFYDTVTVDPDGDKLILRTMDLPENPENLALAPGQAQAAQAATDASGKVTNVAVPAAAPQSLMQVGAKRGSLALTETIAETHAGTEFTLNSLPLGGFVRPKGENDPNAPGGLAAANPWKRLAVLFAGATMNLITGFILFVFLVRVEGYHNYERVQLAEIAPNSPAQAAGMQVGDIVLRVDGQAVDGQDTLRSLILARLDQPTQFTLERGGQTVTVTAAPRSKPPEGQGALGIRMSEEVIPVTTWSEVPAYAARSVADQMRGILLMPAKMMRGTISPEEGRFIGLKGIFDVFQVTVSTDVQSRAPTAEGPQKPTFQTLKLIAALTISIGLINLFPFPGLDGGRIIFVIPELILRRRVPHRFETAVHAVGMVLLILLMLYVNAMDFINPVIVK